MDNHFLEEINKMYSEFIEMKTDFLKKKEEDFQFLIGKHIVVQSALMSPSYIYVGTCKEVNIIIDMQNPAVKLNNSELFGFATRIRTEDDNGEHLFEVGFGRVGKIVHEFEDEESARLFIEVSK